MRSIGDNLGLVTGRLKWRQSCRGWALHLWGLYQFHGADVRTELLDSQLASRELENFVGVGEGATQVVSRNTGCKIPLGAFIEIVYAFHFIELVKWNNRRCLSFMVNCTTWPGIPFTSSRKWRVWIVIIKFYSLEPTFNIRWRQQKVQNYWILDLTSFMGDPWFI